jgi:hypothetical protein
MTRHSRSIRLCSPDADDRQLDLLRAAGGVRRYLQGALRPTRRDMPQVQGSLCGNSLKACMLYASRNAGYDAVA